MSCLLVFIMLRDREVCSAIVTFGVYNSNRLGWIAGCLMVIGYDYINSGVFYRFHGIMASGTPVDGNYNQLNLCKIYFKDSSPFRFCVFRSEQEALAWLSSDINS